MCIAGDASNRRERGLSMMTIELAEEKAPVN
jgi:hypothetical protein